MIFFSKQRKVATKSKEALLRPILKNELLKYRKTSYKDLQKKVNTYDSFNNGRPGEVSFYQGEIEIFYDGRKGGAIRVFGTIDDGTVKTGKTFSETFIKKP